MQFESEKLFLKWRVIHDVEFKRKCKHTAFKFEADFVADPIWCKDCGVNLDIEEFSLSDKLQEELWNWGLEYGKWLDLETDSLKENGLIIEKKYNEQGLKLFQKVKKELGEKYPIVFVPANSAQQYKSLEN